MIPAADTIFALSSGAPPSGVAVIRISGPMVRFGLETLVGAVPPARQAALRTIHTEAGDPIDRGLVIFFPAPASFTGEDVAEFQVHGGRAVIGALQGALSGLAGFRPAEAGEFTRRAFVNGRADLTEVEGIADLVAADTEMQRRLAFSQTEGALRTQYDGWRTQLIRARALVEAGFDFVDEEDISESVVAPAWSLAADVADQIRAHLDDSRWGERVRDGFEVILLGAPNVGKSSLLNALARRDIAIVTSEAGTTRDLIEVQLDIGGYAVTLIDTAGLREADNIVEGEGIRRARRRAVGADLVLLLTDGHYDLPEVWSDAPRLAVRTKADLIDSGSKQSSDYLAVSALSGSGLPGLVAAISDALGLARAIPVAMVTRTRQRSGLTGALWELDELQENGRASPEIGAETLRRAADMLGRVTGRIDVEDLLDVIFSEFCIGK